MKFINQFFVFLSARSHMLYLSLTWFSLLVPYEKNESLWFNNAVLVLTGIQYMFVDTIFIHVLILVVKTRLLLDFPNKSFNMAKKCLASVTYLTFIVYVVKWFYRVQANLFSLCLD